jgi:hypothetical protein
LSNYIIPTVPMNDILRVKMLNRRKQFQHHFSRIIFIISTITNNEWMNEWMNESIFGFANNYHKSCDEKPPFILLNCVTYHISHITYGNNHVKYLLLSTIRSNKSPPLSSSMLHAPCSMLHYYIDAMPCHAMPCSDWNVSKIFTILGCNQQSTINNQQSTSTRWIREINAIILIEYYYYRI